MNERIRELEQQAMVFRAGMKMLDTEKFAELIVEECAERLMQDDFGSVKGVMSIAGARLKEHFGVEQ